MYYRKPPYRSRLAEERVYDRVSNDNGYKRHYNDDRRINGRNHHDLDSRNSSHFRNQYSGRQNSSNSLNSFINDSRYSSNPSNLNNNTNNSSNNELDNSINNTSNSGSLNQRILSSCIQRSNSLSNQGNGSNSNSTSNNNNLLNNSRIGNNQQTTLSSVVVNTSNCNNNNSNNLISQTVTSSPASSFHQLNLNNNNCSTTQNSSSSSGSIGSVTVRNSSIVDNSNSNSNNNSNNNNSKSTIITNNNKESSVTSLTILTKKSNHTSSNLSLASSLDNRDSLSRESGKKSKKKKKKRKKSSSSSLHHHHSSSHYNSRGEHRSNLNNQRCSSSMSCSDNEDNRESHHSTHSSIRHHSSSNFNHNHHSSGSNLNNNNLISGNSGNSSHHLSSNSQHNSLNSSGHHSQTNQYHTHHNSNQHSPIEELDNIQLSPSSSSSNLSTASSSRVSRRCSISPSSTPFNIRNRISTDHISPLHHSSRKQSSASSLDRRSNSGSVFYKSPSNNQTSSQQQSSNSSAIHSQSNQRSSNNNNSSMHYQYSHPISNSSTPTNIINLIDNHGSNSNSDLLNDFEQNSNNRPLAICIRNLPLRSTDTSLKDGLFHEYKKHGKVTMVKVIGKNEDRFAVVCFKKYEDVEKALEVSKDKIFFGSKIEVQLHDRGLEGEDNDRPLEAAQDEYHPKATRTLFVGNLEKEITTSHLRQNFEQFGEIIEIDIKKQGTSTYAFIQYSDICSVVKAIRKLDGENLGNSANRIKLGYGKSMPTTCVWVHGISEQMNEKAIKRQCSRFGEVRNLVIDKQRGNCLLTYDTIEIAQSTVTELKSRSIANRRLQVDFASRECQNSFHQKLEQSNNGSSSIHSRLSSSNSSIVNLNNNNDNNSVNIINSISGNSTISLSNNNSLMSSSYDKTISSNNSNRLSSRLGSITSSPKETNNTNLPPLPQTQWSAKDNNSNASHRLQRLSSTVNSTNNNSSSRHNSLKNYNQTLDNEEYAVDSMDVDFYEDYHSNSNSSAHHNSLRESRRLSEFSSDDKLRGKSFSPHNNKSLDCDILSTKLNDRHLDDKNLSYNKNDEYISKDRLNRRGSEDILSSYESWKFSTGEEDHYKNRFNKSGLTTPNHYHHKNDETNNNLSSNHNKQQPSVGNSSRKHSPLSPINQQGLSNKEIKDAREKQRLNSLNRQQKIQLPMDLPLPEFALNLKLNKPILNDQHAINANKTENSINSTKEININTSIAIGSVKEELIKPSSTKAPLNDSTSSATINNNLSLNINTPTPNLLIPLSIKCDEKSNLQNKTENNKESSSSIMSPLNNNTLTSPINSLRASQQSQRVKSESLSSDNSTENTSLKKSVSECLASPEHSPKNKTPSAKSIDERIRALDNKFIPWSNNSLNVSTNSNLNSKFNLSSANSSIPSTPTDLLTTPISSITSTSNQQTSQPTTPIIDYSKYNIKKKSSSLSSTSASNSSNRNEPSDIVKSLLSKSSIFDQDSKRLENINEKYEPKDNKELAVKDVINKEIPVTLANKEQLPKESIVNNKSISPPAIVSNTNLVNNNTAVPPAAAINKLQLQQQQQKQQPLFRTKAAAKDFHLPNFQQNNNTTVATVSTNNLQNKKDGSISKDNSNKLLTNVSSNSQVTSSSNTPNLNHPSSISQFNTQQTTNIQQNPQQSSTQQTNNQQTTSNVHTQFKNKDDKSSKSKHLNKDHKEKEHKEKEHKEKDHKEKDHFINKEQKKTDNKSNEIKNKSSANSQQSSSNIVHLKKKDKDHNPKDKDHSSKDKDQNKDHKLEKKAEKKTSISSSSSDQQSIKHEIKKQLSEEKTNKHLNKENSGSKEKDQIKEKLAKKKEKQQLKEKHDKNEKIEKLKSFSNKEHCKESLKEKDQNKEKFNKKSKKSKDNSMDLETFSSPASTKQSNKDKEHKQKDNEKKKSKKSIGKEKDKDKEDTIDLEEEIRASKRYIAEMKKLGIQIDNEPMYLSMYDKVKARSSQNQSLKGTQPSAGPSGSNRSKSESDYGGKNKSGRDTETDSESDSSNDEDDELKQNNSRHFNALHHKQHSKNIITSEDSDDEMPFNQTAKNKINKLNRKRKIETSSSSSSSSSESSDSDKDDIKQSKNQLELKRKKKLKKQLSKSSTASTFNWMSDSEEEQKSNKHKNLSPSHGNNKKNKLSNILESKKSADKEEHQINSNKKRSLQEETIKNKDDKIKKKKLQKQLSINEDKNSSIDKENNEKKTSISKSISEHNEDSDDLSTIVSKQSSSSLKKKKKKKDKLKDKNQMKEKSIEHLQSPKSNSSFIKTPLNKQQLKEDLELSDSDSDINENKIIKDKNVKQQIKKETSEIVKDKKHKPKKDEKYEKKSSKNDDNKKLLQSESDSDDDHQQINKIEKLSTKKQKKIIKEKERSIKSKSKIESESSDNESITAQKSKKKDKEHKRNKDKKHQEISSKEAKQQKQHRLKSNNERQSSISDLSVKHNYSDKALTSDSESDSESDNLQMHTIAQIKSPPLINKNMSSSERIFNTLANRTKVFTSDESDDNSSTALSKKDSAAISSSSFLSPNSKLPPISNNIIDNSADAWLMENSQTKCDTWNDITKTEESFRQYLNKTSVHDSSEWEESDDEFTPKSTNLLNDSLLPSPTSLQLNSTSNLVNHALATQILKDPEPRPLTSSTGKEVLKAIKSPKKTTDLSCLAEQQKNRKKDNKQQKEDKCKENNEERKKKNKKSKDNRDQKHTKDDTTKKLLHTDLLFDNKEIKQEPVIAAVAQIHPTQLFGNLNSLDIKPIKLENKLNLLNQPTSPFAEKQAYQLTPIQSQQTINASSKTNRLLTDLNQSINKTTGQTSKLNERNDLFANNSNIDKTKTQLHTSPIKSDEIINSKQKLIKANEMMFSISDESSNEFPAIGVSFSSSSSNSSNSNSGSTSNNQNMTMLPNLPNNKEKQDKQPVQRKYEEEAAIEAKRLEAELMKSKDLSSNWKSFKDPTKDLFLDLMNNTNERLSTSSNNSSKSTTTNLPTNKSITGHKKPQNKSIVLENATTIFNVITAGEVKDPFLDSDETQFKIADGKDELDDQRKIEDDLAVSALLELEMKNTDDLSSEQDSCSNKAINTTSSSNKQRKLLTSNESQQNQEKQQSPHQQKQVNKVELLIDEEPHRLQIAEDELINDNSVDSDDAFHSAIDEMPEKDEEANEAISAISGIIGSLGDTTSIQDSIKSPLHKLRSPLLSPTHNNINLLQPNISNLQSVIETKLSQTNIIDTTSNITNSQNLFNQDLQQLNSNSDYGADENELTIDLNEEDDNLKKSSFMSTLDKLTSESKQRKNSTSSINLFDLPLINAQDNLASQQENEIPTSLADVKQAANKNKNNTPESIHQTLASPKQQSFSSICTSTAVLTTSSFNKSPEKESSNQSATDALLLSPNNRKHIEEELSSDKLNQEQRPRRGRRAKTRKSSESEDGLKLVNTPLSPTNISPNNSLNISGSKDSTITSSKSQSHPRRSARGLTNSNDSNDKHQQEDLVQNDSDNQSTNNADDNQSLNSVNTDSKRKRGRKKKGEQISKSDFNTGSTLNKNETISSNKTLNIYDIFEFNDSDEENSPTLPLMSLHGHIEQSHRATAPNSSLLQDLQSPPANTKQSTEVINEEENKNNDSTNIQQSPVTSFFEQITPITPSTQTPFSLLTNTSPTIIQSNNNSQTEQDKEYTTELCQKGKISITIRLQQKDKDQSINSPEHSLDHSNDKLADDNQNSSNSTDLTASNNKPITRKSARLQSQNNNKTSIDDVIEDVVKGNFNEDSHDYSLSAAENQEYTDLVEEESCASENEIENESHEENQDAENSENKKIEFTFSNIIDNKQQSTIKETNKSSGRITRSSAKNTNDDSLESTNLESVEIKLPNTTFSVSINNDNLINTTSSVTSSITTPPTVITTSKTNITHSTISTALTTTTTSTSNAKQHTVLKVELPKFINQKNNEQQKDNLTTSKPIEEEIKKEEQLQITNNNNNNNSNNSNNNNNNNSNNTNQIDPLVSKLSNSSITPKPSPAASPLIQDLKPNINIPNISERIHNSTTALKLKTGKFHLDDNYQVGYQQPAIIPTVSSVTNNEASQSPQSAQQIHPKLQQPSIPTSVVVTSNSTINQTPITTQPLLINNTNINIPITSSSAASPFKSQQQPPINTQPQLLLQSPFTATGPLSASAQDLNILHQQQIILQQMQQNPGQFMNLNNAYLAALHPDAMRSLPLGTAGLSNRFEGFNPALEDSKLQLQKQVQNSVIESMPPPLLSSIRLPTPLSANYPLIRTPMPPHLLSPHERQNSPVNMQRFTESPYNRGLMSPNPKVDIKPNINMNLQQAHQNNTILQPQRPQSQFSLPSSVINSPSPVPCSILQPQQSNTPNSALSPSLGYRKDLQSPIINQQIDLSNQSIDLNTTAMHPRKLHHKAYAAQQAAKESNLLNSNLMPSPYQIPSTHHLLNNQAAYQQMAALSMQQQLNSNSIAQIRSPQPPPVQQQIQDQTSGDHSSVLMQKHPKLWQGLLALKMDQAAVQMHFVSGNPIIAQNALPHMIDGTGITPLKIVQRMRLETTQLEGLDRKMQQKGEHCILLALPCGRDHDDVLNQSMNLRNYFIQYLQTKKAAGIINSNDPVTNQPAYVVHIFPSCDFANENLARIAPDLLASCAEIEHLLVVIATV